MSGIPKGAKRVFEGIIFDVYQWEQEMFDGSTATFEAVKERDSVQVIPIKDGKVLLSEEEQPHQGRFLGCFGGGVEEGEDPLSAAKRELLEETGLISDDWESYKTVEFKGHLYWNIHYFIARDCRYQGSENPDAAGERITIKELDWEGFLEATLQEEFRSISLTQDILKREHDGTLEDLKQKLFR